jgi:hypothetical protein
MSSTNTDEDGMVAGAGPSTDQHITGSEETGTFQTDKAPKADTPVHGSGNAGRAEQDPDDSPGTRTTYE